MDISPRGVSMRAGVDCVWAGMKKAKYFLNKTWAWTDSRGREERKEKMYSWIMSVCWELV